MIAGLSARPRTLPCKYFYDARGSDLFEQITDLPEYYPTRTEIGILRARAADICARLTPGAVLVEYGSGSSLKTEILLASGDFSAYAPIDISPSALEGAALRLRGRFPELRIEPVVGDFVGDVGLPASLDHLPRTGFFPGSTIGNFSPSEARALLRRMARQLGPGAQLVIGVDLRKSADILEPAYDDAQGVTAAFNLNLLVRLKNELGARLDLDGFAHRAIWNERDSRIEMHLVAKRSAVHRRRRPRLRLRRGRDDPHREFLQIRARGFRRSRAQRGWRPVETFVDADRLFSVRLLEAV